MALQKFEKNILFIFLKIVISLKYKNNKWSYKKFIYNSNNLTHTKISISIHMYI